jgi:hypothetical protein
MQGLRSHLNARISQYQGNHHYVLLGALISLSLVYADSVKRPAECSGAAAFTPGLRVQIKTSPTTHLSGILGPRWSLGSGSDGIRFYSDRAPTAMQKFRRLARSAAVQVPEAAQAVAVVTRLAASTALAYPPLLLVPAVLFAVAWHGHGLGSAAAFGLGLGASFAGGPSPTPPHLTAPRAQAPRYPNPLIPTAVVFTRRPHPAHRLPPSRAPAARLSACASVRPKHPLGQSPPASPPVAPSPTRIHVQGTIPMQPFF